MEIKKGPYYSEHPQIARIERGNLIATYPIRPFEEKLNRPLQFMGIAIDSPKEKLYPNDLVNYEAQPEDFALFKSVRINFSTGELTIKYLSRSGLIRRLTLPYNVQPYHIRLIFVSNSPENFFPFN